MYGYALPMDIEQVTIEFTMNLVQGCISSHAAKFHEACGKYLDVYYYNKPFGMNETIIEMDAAW